MDGGQILQKWWTNIWQIFNKNIKKEIKGLVELAAVSRANVWKYCIHGRQILQTN